MQVTGVIFFPENVEIRNCKIYMRVQDTSLADAPAKTIASAELDYTKQPLPFRINVDAPVDRSIDYTLYVHADLDHDKVLSPGDLLNSQSYRVIVGGVPVQNLKVFLMRIS